MTFLVFGWFETYCYSVVEHYKTIVNQYFLALQAENISGRLLIAYRTYFFEDNYELDHKNALNDNKVDYTHFLYETFYEKQPRFVKNLRTSRASILVIDTEQLTFKCLILRYFNILG